MTPRVLVIAGSDSGGGAGVQADIKTITMLGGHAMTAITAITAQNTLGVGAVHPVPPDMVIAQVEAVASDIGVDAVKIGMIGSAETAHAVADWLEGWGAVGGAALPTPTPPASGRGFDTNPQAVRSADATPLPLAGGVGGGHSRVDARAGAIPVIFDPVMVATSGAVLADAATIAAFTRLMRRATIVTPNLPELTALGGREAVLAHGPALLIKGGHGDGDRLVDRLILADGSEHRWEDGRIATTSTHGTGCTLASAIAVGLARGEPIEQAVGAARRFVRLALHGAPGLGQGHGPMGQQTVQLDLGAGARLNQATLPMTDPAASRAFYHTLGLSEIVATEDGHYYRFEAAGGATLSIEAGAVPTLFLECDDLDAAVARLGAAGLTFDTPVIAQPWGWREARLRDPAGNALCLYEAGEYRRYPPWRVEDGA